MESKIFEVRDVGTFMPVLAVRLEPSNKADHYLLARSGYGATAHEQGDYIMLWRLQGGGPSIATTDYYEHLPHGTIQAAHAHIEKNWHELESGAVVDVEFIAGKTALPKQSESVEWSSREFAADRA